MNADRSADEVCKHTSLPPVPFDEHAAATLSSGEIRRRWPRGADVCPDCKQHVIRYASWAHYVGGDW